MTPDLDALAQQIIYAAEGATRYLVALAGPTSNASAKGLIR